MWISTESQQQYGNPLGTLTRVHVVRCAQSTYPGLSLVSLEPPLRACPDWLRGDDGAYTFLTADNLCHGLLRHAAGFACLKIRLGA